MDTTEYLTAINAQGINTLGVEWQTEVKPAAAWKGHTLTKVTRAIVQTGVDFAALAVNGDRETGALPWGEWHAFPYVIEHKGQHYARLYCVDGTIRSEYFVDGIDVDRQMFETYLTPSQRGGKRPVGGTISVKMSGLRLIGEPALAMR